MSSLFDKMEFCAANAGTHDDASFSQILAYLDDENWRVRYTAAIALGDRRDARAVDGLVNALHREEKDPLFSQPKLEGSAHAGSNEPFGIKFPEGTTEETKEAWRRRGRLLQAVCAALGNIGVANPAALELLHSYAVDQDRDYMVRAAACKALGLMGRDESLAVLEKAALDEEWCTSCEAAKALERMKSRA